MTPAHVTPFGGSPDDARPIEASVVVVRRLVDPLVDGSGFPVTSPYVETCLLQVLGPSSVLLLRRCGAWLAAVPGWPPSHVD